jgi:hypothetical protein
VFEPELLRLRGECLALAGEPGEVRAAWQARAREVALEQGNQALLARLDGPPKTAPAKPAERTL